MKIYILHNGEEFVTEDAVLTAMWQRVMNSFYTDEDTAALTQAYDAEVQAQFGPGARHLGSEQ